MAADGETVHARLKGWIADYCELWGVPNLPSQVTLEYSTRMFRTLGKAYTDRRTIRLASFMLEEPEGLLREILCHEIAHLAATEMYGPKVSPHGAEWRDLMRRAGFEPRARLPAEFARLGPPRRRAAKVSWAHSCPRCLWVRLAGRPVRQWRCASCYRAGRDGLLDIRKVAR